MCVYQDVKASGTFVITAPMAYHCGINLGCKEAAAVKYTNPTWLDIGQHKNLVPTQQHIQNSMLMPFEYILRRDVDGVLAEMGDRGSGDTSQLHSEDARDLCHDLEK